MAGGYLLTLFGATEQANTLGPGGRIALYKTSVDNAARDSARIRKDPGVLRELAHLDRAIARARTPADLFRDPAAVRVLLQGLGLGDQVANIGLAKQALLSDPAKPGALAAKLPDQRWLAATKQLGFAASGLDRLRSAAVRETIANGLVEYRRITDIEKKSEAVANALVLHRKKDGEIANVYTLLGDKVLRKVVETIGGLPKELALKEVEAQAREVQAHVKVADFATARSREKMIQRYLMLAEDNKPDETTMESLIVKL
jgi:hypothetical protein